MEIDPATLDQREVYKLLIGCVVPRPIAWVSTVDLAGRRNLAPFSFFNGVGSSPLALTISVNHATGRAEGRKDTLRNILATGEFVVNIVTEATAAAMNETATDYPEEFDEFAEAGLTPVPSRTVRPPRVGESPVSFECELHTAVPVGAGPGSSTVVIGVVRHLAVSDEVVNERLHIDLHRLRPVARLAGNNYAYVRETFELVRKRYGG
ncbi:MAG TPA: flavin reductase family protein [Chloroflexaceae bacterium]|nr:flavin reductase family protein [Chloroflexaceae bacterium]